MEKVYINSTISIAKSTGTLDILTRVCDPRYREYQSLPSWCPDYAIPNTPDTNVAKWIVDRWNTPHPVIESSPDGLTLTVEGVRCDTIGSITTCPGSSPTLLSAFTILEEAVKLATTLDLATSSRVAPLWEAFDGPGQSSR